MPSILTLPPQKLVPGYWSAYGHSYFMTTVGTLYQTGRMDAVVRAALDIEFNSWANHCVTGAQLVQQGRSQGGHARVLQEMLKSTRTAPYAAIGGATVLCWGINDIGFSGNSSTIRNAFKNALRMAISRARASSIKEDSDASISWGAGWVSAGGTQDFSSGTTIRNASATTNANGTITLPADYNGQTIGLCFVGAGGAFGGDITFAGTASFAGTFGTVTTDNGMTAGTHCPIMIRKKGTSSDFSKTIAMTVARVSASGAVGFDAWWIEADNPPPVIVCNIAKLTTAGYAGYPTWSGSQAGADADVDNFNADIASVVAEFDSMVQIADINSAINKGVPPTGSPSGVTTLLASDGVHPNEYGAARCADAIVTAIRNLAPSTVLGDSVQFQVDSPQAGNLRLPRVSQGWYLPDIPTLTTTNLGTAPLVAGTMVAVPIVVTEARERWIRLMAQVTTAPTGAWTFRWGIYDDVGWTGYPQNLVVEPTSTTTMTTGTTTGMKQSPTSGSGSLNQPLDPGLYWLVFKVETAGTAGAFRSGNGPVPLVPNNAWTGVGSPVEAGWQVTGQGTGVLPTTFPAGGSVVGGVPLIAVQVN